MSDFSLFLKKNKLKKENIKIPASKYLRDDSGKPLLWEIRALTTKEDSSIRDACTKEISVHGRPNYHKTKFDSNKYLAMVAARSIVYPDLNNKQLQDSYGVMCAEDLVTEMLDDPGEYNNFMTKMQEFHGFTETFEEKVEEAKN